MVTKVFDAAFTADEFDCYIDFYDKWRKENPDIVIGSTEIVKEWREWRRDNEKLLKENKELKQKLKEQQK